MLLPPFVSFIFDVIILTSPLLEKQMLNFQKGGIFSEKKWTITEKSRKAFLHSLLLGNFLHVIRILFQIQTCHSKVPPFGSHVPRCQTTYHG